jgi:hypothetical protein
VWGPRIRLFRIFFLPFLFSAACLKGVRERERAVVLAPACVRACVCAWMGSLNHWLDLVRVRLFTANAAWFCVLVSVHRYNALVEYAYV